MSRRNYRKVQKFADGGLVQEDGSPPDDSVRELRTAEGWARKRKEEGYKKKDRELEGTHDRSIGEHLTAGARAMFEGTKFRDTMVGAGARDPKNPLYDRRKAPRED